ncbi:MAG: hypothetical protein KKA84_04125 [Bacteroidetes bacterium]|nr:hypothetical protein [Bacteroidota bacterium]
MKKIIEKLNISQKLGIAAFALGFLGIFAGSPYNTTYAKVNKQEIALGSFNGSDLVSVEDLAESLVKGTMDYRMIDLRPEEEYTEYFIPGSENIPVSDLNSAGLMRNEKILLYDEDNLISSQAWFLLRADEFKGVYILKGGIKEWKEKILFPKLAANASPEETADFEKTKEVSKFFGGVPQVGGEAVGELKIEMPKMAAPAGGLKSNKKKKREGC